MRRRWRTGPCPRQIVYGGLQSDIEGLGNTIGCYKATNHEVNMWNYRVIEFVEKNGNPYRQIHEVYYDSDDKPDAYNENPASVVWDTDEKVAGKSILLIMTRPLTEPVLVEADFFLYKRQSTD